MSISTIKSVCVMVSDIMYWRTFCNLALTERGPLNQCSTNWTAIVMVRDTMKICDNGDCKVEFISGLVMRPLRPGCGCPALCFS